MKCLNLFLIFSICNILHAQESDGSQYKLFKSNTYVKNPLDLRDPFKRKLSKKKTVNQGKSKNYLDGIYSNVNTSIENQPLEFIRVVGIVLGAERRAIVKIVANTGDRDPTIYYLKEGMKVGENNAEVKAILPGGIVLVEKIRNVYDQDEYLETVIPVSANE